MSAPTLDQENALLAPGRTPEQLRELWMAGTAVNLYRDGSTSLDAAAKFASVPKVWLLSMMADDKRSPRLSDEDLGKDAKRYISVDPGILSGTPCLKGTRVPAHYVADMVENGDTIREILAAYPYLTEGQVRAAVAYTRAFPDLARPEIHSPWREQEPLTSSETSLDDLPPPSGSHGHAKIQVGRGGHPPGPSEAGN